MKVINVPDMHCEKCVERITKILKEEGLDFQVSLEEKTVSIVGCGQCVKTAIDLLEDLGFVGTV